MSIAEIMTTKFGAEEQNGLFYFDKAKTLVLFCNGMWCGQSPNNIKSLKLKITTEAEIKANK